MRNTNYCPIDFCLDAKLCRVISTYLYLCTNKLKITFGLAIITYIPDLNGKSSETTWLIKLHYHNKSLINFFLSTCCLDKLNNLIKLHVIFSLNKCLYIFLLIQDFERLWNIFLHSL